MDYELPFGEREINVRKRQLFVSLIEGILPELTPDYRPMISGPVIGANFYPTLKDGINTVGQVEQSVRPTSSHETRILPSISLEFEKTKSSVAEGEISVKTSEKVQYQPDDALQSSKVGFIIHRYFVSESLKSAHHSFTLKPLTDFSSFPLPMTGLSNRTIEIIESQQQEIDMGLQVFTNNDFKRIIALIRRCRDSE